jgi:hypothetical protein
MPSKWLTIGLSIILVVVTLAIVVLLKPKKQTKYSCDSNGNCSPDPNGNYTESTCGGSCTKTTKYSCDSNGNCSPDPNGNYTESTCGGSCDLPKAYGCNETGACVPMIGGKYKVSNCNNQCIIPPFNNNNSVIQVAVMDLLPQQTDLQKLLPFFQKFVPNKILWKMTGSYCPTATATMIQHIEAMISICSSYKNQNLPYPNIALFPDLTDTGCYYPKNPQGVNALTFYPVVAEYHKKWMATVKAQAPIDMVPYLCNELVLEQEKVVNGGDPDAFVACRTALPIDVALSCVVAFTQLTSATGPLIKNSIIGDNTFRPGFVYLEMYNMYTEKVPYLYDVTPSDNPAVATICARNTCNPPLNQSIYGGPSLLSPTDAVSRVMNIMNSFGKFVGFPANCTTPCTLRNFVFLFSYEQAVNGSGPLYLLGNTSDPWNYSKFSLFSNTFVSSVVDTLKPVLPDVTKSDVQVGVYNLENALAQWGV